MANNDNNQDVDRSQDQLVAIRQKWIQSHNKLNENLKEIKQIDDDLKSSLFAAKQLFGLSSKDALLQRKAKLKEDNQVLELTINASQQVIQLLDKHLKDKSVALITKNLNEIQAAAVREYQENPKAFFSKINDILKQENKNLSEDQLMAVNLTAAKIQYACKNFSKDNDLSDLMSAYKLTLLARKIAQTNNVNLLQNSTSKMQLDANKETSILLDQFYSAAAEQMLDKLLSVLPAGAYNLKTLYSDNNIAEVNEHLATLIASISIGDDESVAQILLKIKRDAEGRKFAKAKAELAKNSGFARLALEIQNQLIEQQMFVNQLQDDLVKAENQFKVIYLAELEKYTAKLSDNILNVIENNRSIVDSERDLIAIKEDINQKAKKLRDHVFYEQAKDSAQVGLGLGMAYTLGVVTPPLAALAAGYVLYSKSNAEKQRPESPEIQQDKILSTTIPPVDYKYLKAEDQFWTDGTASAAEPHMPSITSFLDQLNNDATNVITKKVDEVIKLPVEQQVTRVSDSLSAGVKVLMGISILVTLAFAIATIAMLAAGLGFPPVWPFLAAIGFAIVIGQAVFVIKFSNYAENAPKSVLDRLVEFIDLPAQLIAKIFARPIASITANFSQGRSNAGYAIVAGIVGLVIAGAVLLPLIAPVLGIAGGILLGATMGAILGTYLGASISEFIGYKGTSQSMLRTVGITDKPVAFKLSADEEKLLNGLYPALAHKLVDHFSIRSQHLQQRISAAKAKNDSGEIALIKMDIDQLENDWKHLTVNIKNPTTFCNEFEAYLNARYEAERKNYIAQSAARKDKVYDLSKEKSSLVFDQKNRSENASVFEMQMPINYKQERAAISDLHNLKDIVRQIKKGLV